MTDVTVFPHGDRWAVAERGAESPLKEFPTREAAEAAAGDLAAGGTVDVLDEDPTALERSEPPEAGAAGAGGRDDTMAGGTEEVRAPQAGL